MPPDSIRGWKPVCREKCVKSKVRALNARGTLPCAQPIPHRPATQIDNSDSRRRSLRPQSFQIVELTYLGSEYVHDHVAGIDQHPVAIGQALYVDAFDSGFLQAFG